MGAGLRPRVDLDRHQLVQRRVVEIGAPAPRRLHGDFPLPLVTQARPRHIPGVRLDGRRGAVRRCRRWWMAVPYWILAAERGGMSISPPVWPGLTVMSLGSI